MSAFPRIDLRPLLPRFFANRRNDVRAIREAAERGDFSVVRTLAHNMRGTGASFGFPEISALGAKLEDVAKREVQNEVGALASELESLVAKLGADYAG